MKYIDAVKKWNKQKGGGTFCLPKQGSAAYNEVLAIWKPTRKSSRKMSKKTSRKTTKKPSRKASRKSRKSRKSKKSSRKATRKVSSGLKPLTKADEIRLDILNSSYDSAIERGDFDAADRYLKAIENITLSNKSLSLSDLKTIDTARKGVKKVSLKKRKSSRRKSRVGSRRGYRLH